MLRVALVGSRNFSDCDLVLEKLLSVLESVGLDIREVSLVSGGAKGVNTCAKEIAKKYGLSILIYLSRLEYF